MLAYQAMFYYNQPDFFKLDKNYQENIINQVLAKYFDNLNPETKIGKLKLEIARKLNPNPPASGPLPEGFSITWGSFMKCVGVTLVGIFADNLKNFKLLFDVLKGEAITVDVIKAGLNLLGQSMGGWFTFAKAVILFTTCLVFEGYQVPQFPNCE